MVINDKKFFEETKITLRSENYSEWYLDVIRAADLAEYGPVKGSMIIKHLGMLIWGEIKKIIDKKIKEKGVQEAYFPMLIPEKFLRKEKDHIDGFSPEVAVVTYAGGKKLEEGLIVRPTSETIIYNTFSSWVQSHRDLPLAINQWANIVRWEMRPRLFLRTTEFLWQEGHTAHSTAEEADSFAREILEMYRWFAEDILAIPVIFGQKTETEKFSGALKTYSIEAMMQDGKALQFATSHNLGQNFSKAFDIKFINEDNQSSFAWQTSWGLSTRVIGGLIMVHGDDRGIILPPNISPIKMIIIPIQGSNGTEKDVLEKAQEIHDKLVKVYGDNSVVLDVRDIRVGKKYYYWEKRGIPLRIEIGPKDIKNDSVVLVRRDSFEKENVLMRNIEERVPNVLKKIQDNLFKIALNRKKDRSVDVFSKDDFIENIKKGNFVNAYWDGSPKTEEKIKKETGAIIRCISFSDKKITDAKCVYSGKEASHKVVFAKNY